MEQHQTPKPRRFRPLRTKQQEREQVVDERFYQAEDKSKYPVIAIKPEDLYLPEVQGFEPPSAYADDASSYLAIMNIDFQQFDATDALALAGSFLPIGYRALSAWIFYSDYGMKQIANEKKNGPFIDVKSALIKATRGDVELRDLVASHGGIENYDTILKSDPELQERIARSAVVAYEYQKLLYFFAVVKFSSKQAADLAYSSLNNVELESTGCMMDCRFVDEADMYALLAQKDKIKAFAGEVPQGYYFHDMEPANFTQSKPQLSWEQDVRKEKILKRKFTNKEIEEMDARGAWDEFMNDGNEQEVIEEEWRCEEEQEEIDRARALFGLESAKSGSKATAAPMSESASGSDQEEQQFKKVDEKEFYAKLSAALAKKPTEGLTPFYKFLRDNQKITQGPEMSGKELQFRRYEPNVLIYRVDTRFFKQYRRITRKLEECDNNKERILLKRQLAKLTKEHPEVLNEQQRSAADYHDDRFAEHKDDEM